MQNEMRDRLIELLDDMVTQLKYKKSVTTIDIADHLLANGVIVPRHGKTQHFCSVLKAQVFADFFCYHGTKKEREGK